MVMQPSNLATLHFSLGSFAVTLVIDWKARCNVEVTILEIGLFS